MKHLIVTLAVLGVGCKSLLRGGDDVCLVGISTSTGYYSHWIPSNAWTPHVSWDPEVQAFPLDLAVEARRAEILLRENRGVTNETDLREIDIRRYRSASHSSSLADGSNNWYVVFNFSLKPVRPNFRRYVVMLLDGTHASERYDALRAAREGAQPKPSSRPGETTSAGVRVSTEGHVGISNREGDDRRHPHTKIWSHDFEIRPLQWNPLMVPFPLDLTAEYSRAKQHAVTQSTIKGHLVLENLQIQKYKPLEALLSRGERLEDHRFHWETIFRFNEKRGETEPEAQYAVYVLLDGSILGTTVGTP